MKAPVALDIKSPMDLVYELFAKLGLRYICVLKDGKYAGMVSRLAGCYSAVNLKRKLRTKKLTRMIDPQEDLCPIHA